jgi:hypothetical protein
LVIEYNRISENKYWITLLSEAALWWRAFTMMGLFSWIARKVVFQSRQLIILTCPNGVFTVNGEIWTRRWNDVFNPCFIYVVSALDNPLGVWNEISDFSKYTLDKNGELQSLGLFMWITLQYSNHYVPWCMYYNPCIYL